MGLNFIDNFLGGFTFGVLASNSITAPMICNPFIYGGFYLNRVDFETFANPFPSVFGFGCNYSMPNLSMPTTFANPSFPSISFSGIQQSIWDFATNPQGAYNKQMKECQNQIEQMKYAQANSQTLSWFNPFGMSVLNNNQYYQPKVRKPEEKKVEKKKEENLEPEDTDSRQIIASKSASELKSKWVKKQPQLTNEFYNKVIDISKRVKCSPDDLMALMNLETSRSFSPAERNPIKNSTATGLIQFIESTAKGLNTTTAKLAKMTAVEQLDYVEKYLVKNKKYNFTDEHVLSAGELYALVAQPANAKKDVLIRKGTREYEQNAESWDLNKDGLITKAELGKALDNFRA